METQEEYSHNYRGPSIWSRFGLLTSIFVFNLVLPGLLLGYGTILAESVNRKYVDFIFALAVPVFLVGCYSIAQSWCREAADSYGSTFGYRMITFIGLLLILMGTISCILIPQTYHALTYGILNGVGASLVIAQIDSIVFEIFDTKLSLVRGLCLSGQAIAQIVYPNMIKAFTDYYGHHMLYIMLSAIVVQTIPFLFFLKAEESVQRSYKWSRYSDYSRNDSIFSFDLGSFEITSDIQMQDLNKKFWRSPSDENLHLKNANEGLYFDKNRNEFTTVTPPPSPEEKRRNPFGLELLPDIPEESDISESEGNNDSKRSTLNNAIKRLSIMSDNFDETINKANARLEINESASSDGNRVHVSYSTVASSANAVKETINDKLEFKVRTSMMTMKRNLQIPPYKTYKIRRRIKYCFCWLYDVFVKPLVASLLCWRFYSVLFLNTSRLVLLVEIASLLQIFTTEALSFSTARAGNLMVSLHGIGWLCFVISTPWISRVPKGNYKFLTVFGLISSALGITVMSFSRSLYTMSVGCFLSGLGFGGISSTWENTAKEFLGIRDWAKVQSSLETLSGLGVFAVFGNLIQFTPFETSLTLQLQILSAILAANSVIWLTISFISAFYSIKVKSVNHGYLFD